MCNLNIFLNIQKVSKENIIFFLLLYNILYLSVDLAFAVIDKHITQ